MGNRKQPTPAPTDQIKPPPPPAPPLKRGQGDSIKSLADRITNDLFTNGFGEQAMRLVLEAADGRNLGGWSSLALRARIEKRLRDERW